MTQSTPFLFFSCLCLMCGLSMGSQAQQQVHGLVIDAATHEPMPFVSIAVVGSTFGTVSNQNGEFTLNPGNFNLSDSIAFHHLGYETFSLRSNELIDGMIVRMKEKPVSLRSVAIVGNPMSAEQLIKKAVENRSENYPQVAQKREIFQRSNSANYITAFDLVLKRSDIPEVDKDLIQQMVDSLARYSRSYSDYLYTLYTIPADSIKVKNKVEGIKNVILKEDDGGGMEKVKQIIDGLFVHKKDSNTFWKYNTGVFSFKDSHVKFSSSETAPGYEDPKSLIPLYYVRGDQDWGWDFIQKPGRYRYQNMGITGISGEDAYAISFRGRAGGDYQGFIHISMESFAILRIEYSLKEGKKGDGVDLLGINYREVKDEGLLLYERDRLGYFLKYSMRATETDYGIDRPFEIVRKQKRPVLNKKLNEAALRMNFQGRQEGCYETLVVFREGSSEEKFRRVQEKGVKPERITAYSDTIWKGHSIIEPTRQMKEYRVKIRN